MIEVESGSQIILLSARTTSTKAKVHIVATQLTLGTTTGTLFSITITVHTGKMAAVSICCMCTGIIPTLPTQWYLSGLKSEWDGSILLRPYPTATIYI